MSAVVHLQDLDGLTTCGRGWTNVTFNPKKVTCRLCVKQVLNQSGLGKLKCHRCGKLIRDHANVDDHR